MRKLCVCVLYDRHYYKTLTRSDSVPQMDTTFNSNMKRLH